MAQEHMLTVSQFVEVVNFTLEQALGKILVEGEVDEFKIIHNKWVTFKLKDESSSVDCFMTVWQYRTQIEDGMKVKASGMPKLRNKGFFSFVLDTVTPSGEGALKRALQLLQKKLEAEGLFAPERKRALPRFPQHVAFITSRDAAAYKDFLKVLSGRMGGLTVSFIHTQVQGEDAPRQIIEALSVANTELKDLDVIVLVRGGGSLEDLMAFNDEQLVRAVASSRTPTIVGIGHERDITLAELVADVRASTPSNAAELLVPSRQEIVSEIDGMAARLRTTTSQAVLGAQGQIIEAVHMLKTRITSTSNQVMRRVESLAGLGQRFRLTVAQQDRQVTTMERVLASLSPTNTLKRGYSITKTADGRLVRRKQDVKNGETITSTLQDGNITSQVKV
ncbi:MAG: exodeoxyribonuclease VII large subunit [Candidatus Andersenbacteria bacterium]|nr:exodeoxyribonuclease VII large subunit [Candidatus Andersenbacteria bacterium]